MLLWPAAAGNQRVIRTALDEGAALWGVYSALLT